MHGLTINDSTDVLVTVAEQAINLVGGDPAIMTVNHRWCPFPPRCAPQARPTSAVHLPPPWRVSTLAPPINEAELDMVLPLLGPEITTIQISRRFTPDRPPRPPPGAFPRPHPVADLLVGAIP